MISPRSFTFAQVRGGLLAALFMGIVPMTAAQAAKPATHNFKVGGRTLLGEPKTVCVIKGTWGDGSLFRYEGWDSCQKMRITAASLAAFKGWKPRGRKGDLTVADIPAGSEVMEVSNDFSSVLVFRDRNGETREVLIRD